MKSTNSLIKYCPGKPLPGHVYHLSPSVQNFRQVKIKIIWPLMVTARMCLTEKQTLPCRDSFFPPSRQMGKHKETSAGQGNSVLAFSREC